MVKIHVIHYPEKFGGEAGVFGGEASPPSPPIDETLSLYRGRSRNSKGGGGGVQQNFLQKKGGADPLDTPPPPPPLDMPLL